MIEIYCDFALQQKSFREYPESLNSNSAEEKLGPYDLILTWSHLYRSNTISIFICHRLYFHFTCLNTNNLILLECCLNCMLVLAVLAGCVWKFRRVTRKKFCHKNFSQSFLGSWCKNLTRTVTVLRFTFHPKLLLRSFFFMVAGISQGS